MHTATYLFHELYSRALLSELGLQVKLTKINGILLTRVSFETCSGIPGTLYTLADGASASRAPLTIYGPRHLGLYMNAAASYSDYTLRDLQLNVQAYFSHYRIYPRVLSSPSVQTVFPVCL